MNALDVVNQYGSEITGPQGIGIWLFAGSLLALAVSCFYYLLDHQVAAWQSLRARREEEQRKEREAHALAWFWFRAWQKHRVKYIDSAPYIRERSRLGFLRASDRLKVTLEEKPLAELSFVSADRRAA